MTDMKCVFLLLLLHLFNFCAAQEEVLIDYERMTEIEDKCNRKWNVKLKYVDYFVDESHNESVRCAVECVLKESDFIDDKNDIKTDLVKRTLHAAFDASNDIDLRKEIDEDVDHCYNEMQSADTSQNCMKFFKFDSCISIRMEERGEPENILECYRDWGVRPRDIRYENLKNESVRCAVDCIMQVYNMTDETGDIQIDFIKETFIDHLELQNETTIRDNFITELDKCYTDYKERDTAEKCSKSFEFFFCVDKEVDKIDEYEKA